MSKFQIVLIGLFIVFAVAGLLIFSLYRGGGSKVEPLITVWGTVDSVPVDYYIQQAAQKGGNKIRVEYIQKTQANFDSELLEALATGKGPDVLLVSQDQLLKQKNKIYPIRYDVFPAGDFKSMFISEGELLLTGQGVLAIPFTVDPMVMYWNRDIFTNANISLPPTRWDEFLRLVPALTKKDAASNITQSAVAMGEYRNVNHAKDLVSLLIMQADNPIVVQTQNGLTSTLSSSFNKPLSPANSALTFYTQFADPLKSIYTWNRALPDSKTLFLSNKLGIYFGYASEYGELRQKNPNLNFDVALVPQPRPAQNGQETLMTFGKIYSFALLRSSRNLQAAYEDVIALTSKENLPTWTKTTGLPSVRRDALSIDPASPVSSVFATSAIRARGWLDPNRSATEAIFKTMIEGVTSGRALFSEAITQANSDLQLLIDDSNKI